MLALHKLQKKGGKPFIKLSILKVILIAIIWAEIAVAIGVLLGITGRFWQSRARFESYIVFCWRGGYAPWFTLCLCGYLINIIIVILKKSNTFTNHNSHIHIDNCSSCSLYMYISMYRMKNANKLEKTISTVSLNMFINNIFNQWFHSRKCYQTPVPYPVIMQLLWSCIFLECSFPLNNQTVTEKTPVLSCFLQLSSSLILNLSTCP